MQKFHTDPECLLSHESHVEIKSCSKASYLIYKVSIWAEMETCTVCFSLISDSQHASDITENYSDVKANILIWCSFPFEGDGNPWTRFQHLAPVPLSIFRSNSKFDENSERSSVKYTRPITTIFCTRHDSVTVVTCAKYRCDWSNICETRALWIFIEFRIRSKYA